MESHVSPIHCNTFNAIFLRQSFAVRYHQSSGIANLTNSEKGLYKDNREKQFQLFRWS